MKKRIIYKYHISGLYYREINNTLMFYHKLEDAINDTNRSYSEYKLSDLLKCEDVRIYKPITDNLREKFR